MSGQFLGFLTQEYVFEVFDNDFVRVSPAGDCIQVDIKDFRRFSVYWWKPKHPFLKYEDIPPQKGWDRIKVQIVSQDEINVIFYKGDDHNVLTITCADPKASPKPIKVTWE